MAVTELRTALEAHADGDLTAAVTALMSIDAESWGAIESRLSALGSGVAELLKAVASAPQS
jgi:hypothetical protein